MKVSVVIPALNEESSVEECLKSIRRQGQEVELILIDNGSQDNTPNIARKYCDQVYIKPGYSLAEMRDFGARVATGDIIVTTDADCVAPENWLKELVTPFQNQKVVAVGGKFRPLNRNQLSRFYCWISAFIQGFLHLFQGANMAYRRDVYIMSPGYASAKRAEDWNLSWHLRSFGVTKFIRKAYTYTEVPFNRQLEFPGIIISGILIIVGAVMTWPHVVGIGVGYIVSEFSTFIYRHRSNLRRSHLALIGLAIVYSFQKALRYADFMFVAGILGGVFVCHFISEDIRLAIEDLKLYKLKNDTDNSLTGAIKQRLIKFMGL